MKIKYLLSAFAIVAFAQNTFAQYAQDALKFSTFQPGATARIRALGNAGTAIGGDASSIGNNPAGLGFFTKSELSITPEFNGLQVKANYLGNNSRDTRNAVNLSNASVVFYSQLNKAGSGDRTKGWLSFNFGVGYNRTNNFYENINYGGQNANNSIANYYANLASNNMVPGEQLPLEGTLEGIAYDQNLIDLNGNSTGYRSNVLAGVAQASNITRNGGQSEINLSFGLNNSNKFYIGGSLGLATLRYNSLSTFTETGTASVLEGANGVNRGFTSGYTQEQSTEGNGVNVKLGMIFKPVEALRIGALFTSPTWYRIVDNYTESINTRITGRNSLVDGSSFPDFNYNLRTPMKLSGGLAYFFGTHGFITGDVEYQDYSSARLNYDTDRDDNNTIRTSYRSVVNTRFGAEARVANGLFLRGGYSVQGNPLKQSTTRSDIKTISGGLGYRFQNYFVDATYTNVKGSQTILPYDIGTATPAANLDRRYNNAFLTFGVRF
jgi:hypothetical protein